MNDLLLLRQFVQDRSDSAFETLMRRHAGLVYSAALRQTCDAHLAEDVTQAVFIVLSRKAASLSPKIVLSAWLLTTTRLTVINLRRQQAQRRRVEQASANMAAEKTAMPPQPNDWAQIAPLLDDALAGLNETDRAAVVLRFFERLPLNEVGQRLGVSGGAAEKRVARALEKLRRAFARKGIVPAGFILAALMTEHAVHAAPAAVTAALPAALAAANAGIHASAASTLANSAIKVLVMTHTKQLAVCAVLFLSLGLAGGSFLQRWVTPGPQPTTINVPPQPVVINVPQPVVVNLPSPQPDADAGKDVPPETVPPVAEAPRQVSLLSRADLNDTVNGNWTLENGELTCDRTCYTRIEFPYVPPEEYDFHAVLTVLETRDQIALIGANNGRQFMWKFGAHGNRMAALDHEGNEVAGTAVAMQPFEAGRRYDLSVSVRKSSVAAYIDGKLLSSLDTDYRDLTVNIFWRLRNRNALGIGSWATPIRVHSLEVTELTGHGGFLRPEGQPAPPRPLPQLAPDERWKDAVDLLPLIDPARDAVAGTWAKADGAALSCGESAAARLEIPFQPPAEYDLKVVLARDSGAQDLDLILGRAGKSLQWMFGRDNLVSGFQIWSRDTDGINNPCTSFTPNCIANGRPYTVVIQIRRKGFCAFVDGILQSAWDVGDAFGTIRGWDLPTPGLLGVGSSRGRATFQQIQLLEISGKGRAIPAANKRRTPADEPAAPQRPPAPPRTEF